MLLRAFFCVTFLLVFASAKAATIEASLHNYSIRIHPIQVSGQFGFDTKVEVTSSGDDRNGELEPAENFTHAGILVLSDEIFDDRGYVMFADIPPFEDVNGNGINDFFDFDQAVNGEGEGVGETQQGVSPIAVTWSREASNTVGTVTFAFEEPVEGDLQFFTHTFEIFHYAGQFTYERTGTNVTGRLVNFRRLTEAPGEPIAELKGPLNLEVIDGDLLRVLPNTWTNEWEYPLVFESDLPAERAGEYYFADLFFTDFEPFTGAEDYRFALLTLRDEQDSNGNGIPDLSDIGGGNAVPATLGISVSANNLHLHVEGAAGSTYELQFAPTLAGPWTTRQSVTLTSASQDVTLARESGVGFFRLRQQ